MKNYLIIACCVYATNVFASSLELSLLKNEVKKLPPWISDYRNNPRGFLEIISQFDDVPSKSKKMRKVRRALQVQYPDLDNLTFPIAYEKILSFYQSDINAFSAQFKYSMNNVIGTSLTIFTTSLVIIGGIVVPFATYPACEKNSTPQEKWDGTCAANTLGTAFGVSLFGPLVPMSIGFPIVMYRQKKLVEGKIYASGDEDLIATYQILQKAKEKKQSCS